MAGLGNLENDIDSYAHVDVGIVWLGLEAAWARGEERSGLQPRADTQTPILGIVRMCW